MVENQIIKDPNGLWAGERNQNFFFCTDLLVFKNRAGGKLWKWKVEEKVENEKVKEIEAQKIQCFTACFMGL